MEDQMIFDTQVNDVPCKCKVTLYTPAYAGVLTGPFENAEPSEPAEWEFQILTTKGKPAPWLEKYINEKEADRLFDEFQVARYEADQDNI
jgi:hypothetical protein